MAQTLTVSYELHPPSDTPAVNINASKTHEVPIIVPSAGGYKEYYEGLRQSIAQAKDVLGEELTAWRDAVGNRELKKEPKKVQKDDDEEEDEE